MLKQTATMDLNLAFCTATTLMDKHNLLASGWKFEFDNAKRRFGLCHFGTKTISLSKHLVKLNGIESVQNTILHEIAHALVGVKHGHDAVWRAKAIEIGCDGKCCYSREEVARPERKYIGTCPNGHTSERHRMTKKKTSCGRCSRVYDERFLITWSVKK